MSFESIAIHNPNVNPPAENPFFWRPPRTRLILVFETLDDRIIAWGVDPEANELVFRTELLSSQKDPFIAAVTQGREPTEIEPLVSNDNIETPAGAAAPAPPAPSKKPAAKPAGADPGDNAIVISDTSTDGQGPKYRLVLSNQGSSALAAGTKRR